MTTKSIACALAAGAILLWAVPGLAQKDSTGASSSSASSPASAAALAQDSASSASGDDVIHLHMPLHHRGRRAPSKPDAAAAPAATPSLDVIGADTAPAPSPPAVSAAESPAPISAPAKPAKSAPKAQKQSQPAIPFNFGEDSGVAAPPSDSSAQENVQQPAAPTRDTKTASLPPKPDVPKFSPPPVKKTAPTLAKEKPAPGKVKGDNHVGLAKRGAVLFDKGLSNPSPSQFDGLRMLAGDLSTALESGRGPVQLEAYAGARGDKSSGARRLSLERAIAVRQLLIDNGLPSNRIIVRAMGGVDDNGPNDRVDVFVRAS